MSSMPLLLDIIFQIRLGLASGYSLRYAFELSLKNKYDSFSCALKVWERLFLSDEGPDHKNKLLVELDRTSGRRSFLKIIERGFTGAPVDKALEGLSEQLISEMCHKYQKRVQLLPLKLILPMVVFILPAFFILIIVPVFLGFERSW